MTPDLSLVSLGRAHYYVEGGQVLTHVQFFLGAEECKQTGHGSDLSKWLHLAVEMLPVVLTENEQRYTIFLK